MKLLQLLNISLAILLWFPFKLINRKKIILVGGHEGKLYIDNAKAFHQYMTNNHPEYTTYFVSDVPSNFSNENGLFLRRGSFKDYLFFLVAEAVFFSHSCSDVAPIIFHFIRPKKLVLVFIEHGIVGLKKAKGSSSTTTVDALGPLADLTVASSAFEKEIKCNDWRIPKEQIIVTGIPRYDQLIKPKELRKEILYMPTWREWLIFENDEEFIASDFFQEFQLLMSNEELKTFLIRNNFKMKIYIHFYFHKYHHLFDNGDGLIDFLPPETDIQDYLINSDILITDYSSVAWDFFYLDKPIIFYQPDLTDYLQERGTYIDYQTDLIGLQAVTQRELLAQLKYVVNNKEKVILDFKPLKMKYFAFNDQQNSERIFIAFKKEQATKGLTK